MANKNDNPKNNIERLVATAESYKSTNIILGFIVVLGGLIISGGLDMGPLFIIFIGLGIIVWVYAMLVYSFMRVFSDMATNIIHIQGNVTNIINSQSSDKVEPLKDKVLFQSASDVEQLTIKLPTEKRTDRSDASYKDIPERNKIFKDIDLNECSDHGTIPWFGGDFTGQLMNNKPHGKGKLTLPNEAFYEGEWLNGKPNGYGKMLEPNKSVYDGEWKNGKKHGRGIHTYPDGSKYKGEWENGVFKG